MPNIALTAKEIAKMVELRKRGHTIKQIATQFRRSVAHVSSVLLEQGFEKGVRSSKW
jgi:hypothetical protein